MKSNWHVFGLFIVVSGLTGMAGCSQQADSSAGSPSAAVPVIDGAPFVLNSEPAGAEAVIKVRETAEDGDDVVVTGRIGGSENPWIESLAAFSIVDESLKACSDIEGDQCPIPWDYCCELGKLPTSTALVKVVDSDGQLVKADARQLLNVKELSTVVVTGKAQRDDAGNLTVLATGVFLKE